MENTAQQDSAECAFNKLGRTFAAQVEAVKQYRSRSGQTVRVEHVTVNEGGQAIVGNVAHRGGETEMMEVEVDKPPSRGPSRIRLSRGRPESRGATNARADARGNEVWSENAQGNSLSVTGCTRKEEMPNAWRGSGQWSSFR